MTMGRDGDINFRRFDLNLLPILRALLATHSVTRASDMLGLSQSATSGALTRLRAMFGDELFVHIGRNLVPTPRALELQTYVEETFSRLHTLFDKRVFDPSLESRQFTISTSDFIISELCVPLLNRLSVEAPNVSVKFVSVSPSNQNGMMAGEVDFMMTPQNNPAAEESVHVMSLSEEEMAIISAASYPMPKDGLDLDTYLAADHASYAVAGAMTFEQWAMAPLGLARTIRVYVPLFTVLPSCVAGTGTLAMVPRHVAERAKSLYDLKIWPVPFDMPRVKTSLYWSGVLHQNPAHEWFRGIIREAWQQALAIPAPTRPIGMIEPIHP